MPDLFPLEKLTIVLLKPGISVANFDCKDSDLNEFITKDAFDYNEKGLAKTYVALYENEPIAFVSICTDAIRLTDKETVSTFGADKHHSDYPAMKIARLGRHCKFRGQKIGEFLVRYIIGYILELAENFGCRFVTTDAIPSKEDFYCEPPTAKAVGFLK